jgi:hypothetical protein
LNTFAGVDRRPMSNMEQVRRDAGGHSSGKERQDGSQFR